MSNIKTGDSAQVRQHCFMSREVQREEQRRVQRLDVETLCRLGNPAERHPPAHEDKQSQPTEQGERGSTRRAALTCRDARGSLRPQAQDESEISGDGQATFKELRDDSNDKVTDEFIRATMEELGI